MTFFRKRIFTSSLQPFASVALAAFLIVVQGGCDFERPKENPLEHERYYEYEPAIVVDPNLIVSEEGRFLRIAVDPSGDARYPVHPFEVWDPDSQGMSVGAGKTLSLYGVKIPGVKDMLVSAGEMEAPQTAKVYDSDVPIAFYFRCADGFDPNKELSV